MLSYRGAVLDVGEVVWYSVVVATVYCARDCVIVPLTLTRAEYKKRESAKRGNAGHVGGEAGANSSQLSTNTLTLIESQLCYLTPR